jgi:hypothetical protein
MAENENEKVGLGGPLAAALATLKVSGVAACDVDWVWILAPLWIASGPTTAFLSALLRWAKALIPLVEKLITYLSSK